MRPSALITGLYPPAIRQRWGAEILQELTEAGIGSWPDTIGGAARLWLHPSDWPETLAGQTRRVLAVAFCAITAITALLLRATQPSTFLTADLRHPLTSAWLAPLLVGIAVAAPLPPLRPAVLRSLTTVVARVLAAPVLAVLTLPVMARSGLLDHPTGLAHATMVVYYWATLGFTALCLCVLSARLASVAIMPSTRRLRVALLLFGTGLGLATVQCLLPAVLQPARGAGSTVVTASLGVLAGATITAGLDLRKEERLGG